MPVWHVSVAFLTGVGALPVTEMRLKMKRQGVDIAKSILAGVGKSPIVFITNPPGVAIHVQKPLKDEEIELLPKGWMDIAAIDERGDYTLLSV